jgi:hypothetical protein
VGVVNLQNAFANTMLCQCLVFYPEFSIALDVTSVSRGICYYDLLIASSPLQIGFPVRFSGLPKFRLPGRFAIEGFRRELTVTGGM